jgi:hypothetical protein
MISCFYPTAMHVFTHLMAYRSMTWQFLSQKVGSILPGTMMTYASFVQMVGIFCFVMDAQGPSIKVNVNSKCYKESKLLVYLSTY